MDFLLVVSVDLVAEILVEDGGVGRTQSAISTLIKLPQRLIDLLNDLIFEGFVLHAVVEEEGCARYLPRLLW